MSHRLFRKHLTDYLEKNDVSSKYGYVAKDKIILDPGFPGGSHGQIECWLFKTFSNNLVMAFGFYANFTADDLFCKVGTLESIVAKGIGASIQFNGSKSISTENDNHFKLIHSGSITVGHSINRDKLAMLINEHCKYVATQFQITNKASWPLEIGSTKNINDFIDKLFLYSYAIEQAKRSLRNEKPLSDFDAVESEKKNVEYQRTKINKVRGQGFLIDPILNKLIEEYAMLKAIEFYKELGFSVNDVSATESFDLLCEKGKNLIYVEVKGSSLSTDSIIMTLNEVELAKKSYPFYELFIVDNIIVDTINKNNDPSCSGGSCKRIQRFKYDEHKSKPISFRVTL